MRKNIVLCLSFLLVFTGCSGSGEKGRLRTEENRPDFKNSRQFVETPELVIMAARKMLDELAQASNPPITGSIKGNNERVSVGWVYGVSKDKYVEFNFNGVPKRKLLNVRRRTEVNVTPSLAGSQVVFDVEEELEVVDLKTGQPKGWKSVKVDAEYYDTLTRKLRESLRSL
jgi:hypothetical protein